MKICLCPDSDIIHPNDKYTYEDYSKDFEFD